MNRIAPLLAALALTIAGCPSTEASPDVGSGTDVPRADAPEGLDVPGLDAPGLDAPSELDAPGLDAPGLDAPGLDAPVVDGGGSMADPAADGPYATSAAIDDVVVRGTRRTPVSALVPTLPPGETAPLVVFLPGFQLRSDQYAETLRRIASHGFVVVGADPPGSFFSVSHVENASDAIAAIDWALATPSVAPSVDATRIAMMGHSLGGKVSVMAAARDVRIDAVLLLDPVNGGAGPSGYSAAAPDIVPEQVTPLAIPFGIFGETLDGSGGGMPCAPAAQNYATFYDAAAAGSAPWAAEWTLTGANHMQFLDDRASCGLICSFCAMPSAADAAVLAAVRTLSVAYLRRHLRGETAMDAWLTGASTPAGVTTRHDP